jgi:selenocysteine lyase/cysteine desulfurase
LEAGTINLLGVIGLSCAIRYLEKQGLDKIYAHEMSSIQRLRDGLSSLRKVRLYCAETPENHLPLLLCNVQGMDPEQVSTILDGDFGIATRAGLHCAPLVHEDLGTSPKGGVRFSLGPFNTDEEIDEVLEAMTKISRGK